MKHILIVGTSFSTLRHYLDDNGYQYTTLKDHKLTKKPDAKLKHRVVCDFSQKETILTTVETIQAQRPIDGVIATYENYILPASWITKHLGLPGISTESALACSDKNIMRQLFAKAPAKISPDFAVASDEAAVLAFARAHSYPLILKPANLSKSLLVTKNYDEAELLGNFHRALETIDGIYKRYAPGRERTLLIEEFMEGPIHSVDAFVDASGAPTVLDQVVDYQTGYDIGYDDNFHYSRLLPSKLPSEEIKRIHEVAELGVRALGMKSSPAHIEIIRTEEGPRIVEIGARNGGYRERMHMLANGIDITGAALALALDKPCSVLATKNEPCAVLELFPKTAGTFTGIASEAALEALPSLTYYAVKAKPGEFAGKSSEGHKMCAVIILHNPDAEQFAKDLAYVNSQVYVQTEPAS